MKTRPLDCLKKKSYLYILIIDEGSFFAFFHSDSKSKLFMLEKTLFLLVLSKVVAVTSQKTELIAVINYISTSMLSSNPHARALCLLLYQLVILSCPTVLPKMLNAQSRSSSTLIN